MAASARTACLRCEENRRSRPAAHIPRAASKQFTSIIPEVLEEIEVDGEYQAMLDAVQSSGQEALTELETAKRQAVLTATGIQAWSRKMEVFLLF